MTKMKTDCMKVLLDDYVSGRMKMYHQMNIFLNSKTNYLMLFGERIYNGYKCIGKTNEDVERLIKRVEDVKFNYLRRSRILSPYEDLAIFFLTDFLNEEALVKMFGEGVKHSHFGEGFEDKREYQYISYMIELDDAVAHIGLDHRGTSLSFNMLDAGKTSQIIFRLIDLYIEKL